MPSLVLGCIPIESSGKVGGLEDAQARDVRLLAGLEAGHRVALVVDAHPQLARLGRGVEGAEVDDVLGRRLVLRAVDGVAGLGGLEVLGLAVGVGLAPRSRERRWSRRSPRPGSSSPMQSRFSKRHPEVERVAVGLGEAVESGVGIVGAGVAGVPVVKPTTTPAVTPTSADTRSAIVPRASQRIPLRRLGPGSVAFAHQSSDLSAISRSRPCMACAGQAAAVRGGVDQPERRVRHGPCLVRRQLTMATAQLLGPEVDVLALEAAHPLARLDRERLPVAVLDHDQRGLRERELHVPVDQRRQRVAGVRRREPPAPVPRSAGAR